MVFKPFSTIYLCSVPFDNTYKNQVYFSSRIEQEEYFSKRVKKTFSEYLTVRETLPDGSPRSYIKVNAGIDELRLLDINYVSYMNVNLSAKTFYAFITEMIYVNEGTTKLVIETDVYQTWLFEATLLDSFVVREHSVYDDFGGNIVPEKFSFENYELQHYTSGGVFDTFGYLIASSSGKDTIENSSRGRLHTGVYQGLHFYYYESVNEVNSCLDALEAVKGDCVQFIAVIPKFCLGNSGIDDGNILANTGVAQKTVELTLTKDTHYHFDGYRPKNNKLFSEPYFNILVTNNNGDQAEYALEDFPTYNDISFKIYGDISGAPSVTLLPTEYKGAFECNDFGVTISNFPKCAFNSDSYKLWLAKNEGRFIGTQMGAVLNTVGGVASLASGNVVGGALTLGHVAQQIGTLIGDNRAAKKQPNIAHAGSTSTNLLTAMGKNDFEIYLKKLKREHAITVDNYFTMYGYQTNKVKKPNVSSRPYFNYVETIDVNIVGGIPSDHMAKLKSVYNNGVTLWKPSATIGDYSVDNSPS